MIPSLPPELWDHIFDYAFDYPNLIDPDDGSELRSKDYARFKASVGLEACYAPAYCQILPLLSVNSLFYNLLVPKLYRHVSLPDTEPTGLFLNAVERAPRLAKHVVTFDLKKPFDTYEPRKGVSQSQGCPRPSSFRPNLGWREVMLERLLHRCYNLKAVLVVSGKVADVRAPFVEGRVKALELYYNRHDDGIDRQCPQIRPLPWVPLGAPHAVVILGTTVVAGLLGENVHAVYLNDTLCRVESNPSEHLDAFFAASQPGLLDVTLLTSAAYVPLFPIWSTRSLPALQRSLRNLCIQEIECPDRLLQSLSDVLIPSSTHQQQIIFLRCRFRLSRTQVLAFLRVSKASVKLIDCEFDLDFGLHMRSDW